MKIVSAIYLTAALAVPAAYAQIQGVIFTDAAEVKGSYYAATIPIEDLEPDSSGGWCSATQEAACWQACENQIIDAYCAQLGTWCETNWATGGITCHCGYFCAKDAGGVQHRPHRLGVVDPTL